MASKSVLTLRMNADQYNAVVTAASKASVSLNEYCLMMIGVQGSRSRPKEKKRGRVAKLLEVSVKSQGN